RHRSHGQTNPCARSRLVSREPRLYPPRLRWLPVQQQRNSISGDVILRQTLTAFLHLNVATRFSRSRSTARIFFFGGIIMARYGTLGDYRFSDTQEAALDIRGAKVYGPKDHKLGEIDDVVFDEATGAIIYVVVDTGGWLSSKRFIVPPAEV